MKKFLIIGIILVLGISCAKQEKSQIIEGEVIGATIFVAKQFEQVTAQATIKDLDGKIDEVKFSVDEALKMLNKLNSNYPSKEPYYIRAKRIVPGVDNLSFYEIKETAILDYDHGTPPRYVFPSDKKLVGFYQSR